jgi:hypothetical protein
MGAASSLNYSKKIPKQANESRACEVIPQGQTRLRRLVI